MGNGGEFSDPGRLRVYHLAFTLADRVDAIVRRARCSRSLADQVLRSSESTVLNIAEGAADLTPRQKVHHFRIAHGSVLECAAALDMLARRDRRLYVAHLRRDADMIARMLARLIENLSR
jgi:four helix bundle protein